MLRMRPLLASLATGFRYVSSHAYSFRFDVKYILWNLVDKRNTPVTPKLYF